MNACPCRLFSGAWRGHWLACLACYLACSTVHSTKLRDSVDPCERPKSVEQLRECAPATTVREAP